MHACHVVPSPVQEVSHSSSVTLWPLNFLHIPQISQYDSKVHEKRQPYLLQIRVDVRGVYCSAMTVCGGGWPVVTVLLVQGRIGWLVRCGLLPVFF